MYIAKKRVRGALHGVIFNSENTAMERRAENEERKSSLQLSVWRVKKECRRLH
jgi:hypothetical protein